MHPFFDVLDRYEVSLLLTALTVGGEQAIALFASLGEPLGPRVSERAQALLAMPEETRKPLMATELKSILGQEGQVTSLGWIDATWLLHALRGEPPRIVALILLGLESGPMNALLKRLPHSVRRQLPPKSELSAVDARLQSGVRQLFALRFAPMPEPSAGAMRDFEEIIYTLERDELYRLIRDLGLTELGQAFAVVEKMALLELCRRLGKAQAMELLAAVQHASQVDQPDAKTAQHFLGKIVANFDDVEEFLQKSGLWRLARASWQGPSFWLTAMTQRLPRQAGQTFGDLLNRAHETLSEQEEEVRLRLRDAILLRVVQLAREGHIRPNWQESQVDFHDKAACQAVLNPKAPEAP
jgi:hypothetical protein